ncbi:helix-turn-helix domain-containing protein [Kordiimonas sp. SCSIO 12610]|uniref:helix-turn-helix domain-containing protein n=1 Tax=Kordiimonas sp. SCSIO 12610 TaxID=2829597 RepID=UPI002108E3A7|nr:helix-turn-helix domain-containing protein [Kordiimonas sp. SCSIO 12610]UTW55743.1 helix-turn-helix domain-containing protein [Kordiimonas sp. SCSIO 12610]
MKKSDRSVAERLKAVRQEKDLSLSEVAKETCISICYLKAIEAENYDELPAQTFTIGFIKSYAQILGLDCDEMVRSYKEEANLLDPPKPVEIERQNSKPSFSIKPEKKKSWFAPAIAALGIAGVWSFTSANVTMQTMVADVPAQGADIQLARLDTSSSIEATNYSSTNIDVEQPQAPSIEDSATGGETNNPTLETAAQIEQFEASNDARVQRGDSSLFTSPVYADTIATDAVSHDVTIVASEESWVRFARVDGSEVWSGILHAGEQFKPKLEQNILFSTSNAGAVQLMIGGRQSSPLGSAGEVISAMPLDSLEQTNHSE